jgi:hypothetical protein
LSSKIYEYTCTIQTLDGGLSTLENSFFSVIKKSP